MSDDPTPPISPSTDDAPADVVLDALLRCYLSWRPDVRVLGNVRACDAVRAISELRRESLEPLTEQWLDVNVNQVVRVKLTDRGRRHYFDKRGADQAGFPLRARVSSVAKEDAEGWYRTSLWALMNDFGAAMYMGPEPAFTVLEILQ